MLTARQLSDSQQELATTSVSAAPLLEEVQEASLLRRACLGLSNAILRFPMVFELQQKALSQPTLIRGEVELELANIPDSDEFKVIDYGCGSGTYSGLFNSKNYLGIDCNEAMLNRASAQHPDHAYLRATDLSGISSTLNRVSQIFMIGVIHHLAEADLVAILKSIPRTSPVKLLAIDTLKCESGPGRFVQLFERGEYLRTESEHLRLLNSVAEIDSYKKLPYGSWFELAVIRGTIRQKI